MGSTDGADRAATPTSAAFATGTAGNPTTSAHSSSAGPGAAAADCRQSTANSEASRSAPQTAAHRHRQAVSAEAQPPATPQATAIPDP